MEVVLPIRRIYITNVNASYMWLTTPITNTDVDRSGAVSCIHVNIHVKARKKREHLSYEFTMQL